MRPLVCALCGKEVRSVYALPGEREAKFCRACFFGWMGYERTHFAATLVGRVEELNESRREDGSDAS